MTVADRLVGACMERSCTVGTAESVTGGQVAADIASVPGCSTVFRGGIVSYATDVKRTLLQVPEVLLAHVVSAEVAEAMVLGAQQVLAADLAIATTGVAGPDWLDDQPPGRVWIAAGLAGQPVRTRMLDLAGDRAAIRALASEQALGLALDLISR
jgi:nicotinamide-nucleotide amidase